MPQLDVTSEAARWIRIFMEQERREPKDSGFRLGVRGGGCSGMQYMMGITDLRPGDHVFEQDGVRVFVDPKSMPFLEGSKLHFLMKYQGAGFVVVNPQVAGTCGCGTSFAPKTEAAAVPAATAGAVPAAAPVAGPVPASGKTDDHAAH